MIWIEDGLIDYNKAWGESLMNFNSLAMISYNIITGDTLTKVFQKVPGGR